MFDLIEKSVFKAKPVMLFEFYLQAEYWRYAQSSEGVIAGNRHFNALKMTSSGFRRSLDINKSDSKITIPRVASLAEEFRISMPSEPIRLNVYCHHRGDDEIYLLWRGGIVIVEQLPEKINLTCSTKAITGMRKGLRSFQVSCPHTLYDESCKVDKEAFRVDGRVDTLGFYTLTSAGVSGHEDNHFAGGFIEWTTVSGRIETVTIESSLSDGALNLIASPLGLNQGDPIKVYPGCNRSFSRCSNTYNNHANYGGCPYIPGHVNPFAGDPVF